MLPHVTTCSLSLYVCVCATSETCRPLIIYNYGLHYDDARALRERGTSLLKVCFVQCVSLHAQNTFYQWIYVYTQRII